MHNALLVAEIFEVICRYSPRSTLASLAQTCHAFNDPALDTLWEEGSSLDLMCLLPDSIEMERTDHDIAFTVPCQYPSFAEWQRMREYTSRVIRFELTLPSGVDVERLRLLVSHRPPEAMSPMFPKLKAISASLGTVNSFMIPIVKFPWTNEASVTEISIRLSSRTMNEEVLALLGELGDLYPHVRRADLDGWNPGPLEMERQLVENISKSIKGWKHLTHGSFTALDNAAHEYLYQLESLNSLSINIARFTPFGFREIIVPSAAFPSLAELTLRATDTSELITWIGDHHRSLSALHFVAHSVVEELETPVIHALCNSLATYLNHLTLLTFSFNHWNIDILVPMNTLQPSFVFSQLRFVMLSCFGSILVNDDGLRQLASSWPLLEVLELTHYSPTPTAQHPVVILPTLRGFLYLVEKCPRLRKLYIVIDTRDSEWIDIDNPSSGVCNCGLTELMLGNSPINDPVRMAAVLRKTFPLLEAVETIKWRKLAVRRVYRERNLLVIWDEVNAHIALRTEMPKN